MRSDLSTARHGLIDFICVLSTNYTGICVAQSLTILRDDTDSRIEQLVIDLLKNERAKVVVMFANEDNAKRVLKALLKLNKTSELTFLASDSWGAKIHPVKGQELAAEGAVTLLPTRHVIQGNSCIYCCPQDFLAEMKVSYVAMRCFK
jgi:metabotropic glutamate receptor 6/7/8